MELAFGIATTVLYIGGSGFAVNLICDIINRIKTRGVE